MSTEENKAAVRCACEDVINSGDGSLVDATVAPTYMYHTPGMPDIHGPGGYKELVSVFRTAFPDLRITVEDLFAEGDKVAHRWRLVGTHQGDLMGIPPTGKKVDVTGMAISHMVGGKVEEEWGIFDQMGLMQQLGVVPTQGQGGG
jgi:steroid delta-isomerase-like uncharacterized protein